jgi:hypothetical protein
MAHHIENVNAGIGSNGGELDRRNPSGVTRRLNLVIPNSAQVGIASEGDKQKGRSVSLRKSGNGVGAGGAPPAERDSIDSTDTKSPTLRHERRFPRGGQVVTIGRSPAVLVIKDGPSAGGRTTTAAFLLRSNAMVRTS